MADDILETGGESGADQIGGAVDSNAGGGILDDPVTQDEAGKGVLDASPPGADKTATSNDGKKGEDPNPESNESMSDKKPDLSWKDMQNALSNGDETLSRIIGRYRSPQAFAKAFAAQRQTISENGKTPELPEKATEEQIAEYRKTIGLPEKFDDYNVGFSEDFQANEGDDALVKEFAQSMYDKHVPQKYAQAAIEYYQTLMMKGEQNINENAAAVKRETYDTLKAEWGREFDANRNAIDLYLYETMGNEGRAALGNLQLSDGSSLLDNADILRLLSGPARDYVGGEALVSGSMSQSAEDAQKQLNDLLKLQITDPDKYRSEPVQKQVAELYERKKRFAGRGQAA